MRLSVLKLKIDTVIVLGRFTQIRNIQSLNGKRSISTILVNIGTLDYYLLIYSIWDVTRIVTRVV